MFLKTLFGKNIKKYIHLNQNISNQCQLPTPIEFIEIFDKVVVGQAFAKKKLSVAIYNHYLQVEQNEQGIYFRSLVTRF